MSNNTTTTLATILLVEDEPAVRQLFAQALSRAGYAVLEARNGQEAMKLFDQHGETIDLLLTDMRMPYMGGAELAHHLRGRRRSLKLLCISGYPGSLDPDLSSDFLAKPFFARRPLEESARGPRKTVDRRPGVMCLRATPRGHILILYESSWK